jgi:hypothetical protein
MNVFVFVVRKKSSVVLPDTSMDSNSISSYSIHKVANAKSVLPPVTIDTPQLERLSPSISNADSFEIRSPATATPTPTVPAPAAEAVAVAETTDDYIPEV